jgi:hypothetical protein
MAHNAKVNLEGLASLIIAVRGERASHSREGEAGYRIPGSRMVRAYCRWCGGPMRMYLEVFKVKRGECTDCVERCHPPARGTGQVPWQRYKRAMTTDR